MAVPTRNFLLNFCLYSVKNRHNEEFDFKKIARVNEQNNEKNFELWL